MYKYHPDLQNQSKPVHVKLINAWIVHVRNFFA